MCTQAGVGGINTHTHTHRWGADFVVLSQKEGAVRLHMELSMNTNSKMRTRCRIPFACWERKIEAQRERERGRTGQMKAQKAGRKERERERVKG